MNFNRTVLQNSQSLVEASDTLKNLFKEEIKTSEQLKEATNDLAKEIAEIGTACKGRREKLGSIIE